MQQILETAKTILDKEAHTNIKFIHKKDSPINFITEKDGIKYAIAVSEGFKDLNSERISLLSNNQRLQTLLMFVWSPERYELVPIKKFIRPDWKKEWLTIWLPPTFLEQMEYYVKKGFYRNVREFIVEAIHQQLSELRKLDLNKTTPYKQNVPICERWRKNQESNGENRWKN